MLLRTPLVAGGDACTGALAAYAFDLDWISLAPRVSACREHAQNAFVATDTDDFAADARVAHAWHLARFTATAQVEAGGAVLHQHFTTAGMAPPRTVAAASFGGGGSLALDVARGVSASLAGEVDTFVMRNENRMTLGAMFALAVTL